MGMELSCLSITLLLLFAQNTRAAIFDITKYGKGPDFTQGFLSAWKDACGATTSSVILIPPGNYLMNAVRVEGQCKAPMEIRLQGTLQAPEDPKDMHGADGWITMNYVDHITITGGGTFDGRGKLAWERNDCSKNKNCVQLPINIRFNFVTNSIIHHVTSKDSKNFHINVIGCKNLTFEHFTISTPETSINTDGIHVGRSTDVKILNSDIRSGDDCISIGDGMQQLLVKKVNCGPGHGFSIGSLGRNKGESNINGIHFTNCTLTGTQNGLRIKTWPSSPAGYSCLVSNVRFENIIMNNVGFPVLIDQQYCPYNLCDKSKSSLVQISDVHFKNVKGTSASEAAVKLSCSKAKPCQKVTVEEIDLKYTGPGGVAKSLCSNVRPGVKGKQNPQVCTGPAESS